MLKSRLARCRKKRRIKVHKTRCDPSRLLTIKPVLSHGLCSRPIRGRVCLGCQEFSQRLRIETKVVELPLDLLQEFLELAIRDGRADPSLRIP